MSVFAWASQDNELVISKDSTAGEPCLCIPLTKEAVWEWIRALQVAVEDGEWDGDLPGEMKTVAKEER